ncbi:MAG: hypothetical protein OXC82_02315, partial [Rhodobacteraceae bacterium]|nr:hypothetical protein [Paracoccaceae bacterium]
SAGMSPLAGLETRWSHSAWRTRPDAHSQNNDGWNPKGSRWQWLSPCRKVDGEFSSRPTIRNRMGFQSRANNRESTGKGAEIRGGETGI